MAREQAQHLHDAMSRNTQACRRTDRRRVGLREVAVDHLAQKGNHPSVVAAGNQDRRCVAIKGSSWGREELLEVIAVHLATQRFDFFHWVTFRGPADDGLAHLGSIPHMAHVVKLVKGCRRAMA